MDKRGGYTGGGHASKMTPPAQLPQVEPGPAPGAFALITTAEGRRHSVAPTPDRPERLEHSDRGLDWTNGYDYPTLRGYTVVDGVAYSHEEIRRFIRERHVLAGENVRLALEVDELREKLRRASLHLQKRTAALTRLVARKGPVL
jgi:hypothetical protein